MALAMAKKKQSKQVPEPEARVRTAVTMVRSTPEWKAAVDQLTDFDRAPSVSDLIDRAVAAYARSVKFPDAIPKR